MANLMDASLVFDTLLCSPGMSENVKIDLRISRKTVLLLNRTVERGLRNGADDDGADLITTANKESLNELQAVMTECIQKAGLTELSEKITALKLQ
jgi:hypothetical protein